MYTIGEFARMAQVSRRQLRHWEDQSLLTPARTDPATGYRYYRAGQLITVNRIKALRDLGLSLEQIAASLDDDVSVDELQGMLLLRRAQVEQQVRDEMVRLRRIESRLAQLRDHEQHVADVVVKTVPAQPYVGLRSVVDDWSATVLAWAQIDPLVTADDGTYGPLLGVLHADGLGGDEFDLEVGRLLLGDHDPALRSPDGRVFRERTLPAADLACFVQVGTPYEAHIGASAIGEWAELNGYAFSGPMRGLVLEAGSFERPDALVTEIQFPIVRAADVHDTTQEH